MMRRLFSTVGLPILLCLLPVSLPLHAADDYIWAMQFGKKIAKAKTGDAQAQYEVGNMYLRGRGVERNGKAAYEWFSKAADQGHVRAQYKVGYLYFKGEGVDKDPNKALKWIRRAADQDYAPAQFYLGKMYSTGVGVARDYEQAWTWFSKAEAQNYHPAKGELANLKPLLEEQRAVQRKQQQADAAQRAAAQREAQRRAEEAKREAAQRDAQQRAAEVRAAEIAKKRRALQLAKADQPAKQAPAAPTRIDYLEQLLAGGWIHSNAPAHVLPSEVNNCKRNDDKIECLTGDLVRQEEYGTVTYQVQSIMAAFNQAGEFRMQYRENITLIFPADPDDPDVVIPLNYGWQQRHVMSCKFSGQGQIDCVRDNKDQLVYTKS